MKKFKLRWTRGAKDDLASIKGYIAQFAERNAVSYVKRIRERCLKLTTLPFAAPIVAEYQDESIREVYFGSYRILYKITSQEVTVLRVFHGSRLLTDAEIDGQS
jgi:plasmid stabilization system protein ParE